MTLGSNLQGCELNVLLKKVHYFLKTHSMELPQWVPKCDMFGQGLLYLDGRNSQKYLHQDQADF